MTHHNIKPFEAWVWSGLLYGNDKAVVGSTKCTVFAVSFYEGEVPSFFIKTYEGGVFCNVPPHYLTLLKDESDEQYDINIASYHDCRAGRTVVFSSDVLYQHKPMVYVTFYEKWFSGSYILTVDWIDGNDLLHLIAIDNGCLTFQPSHKINFDGDEYLPSYKKLKDTFSLGR